MIQKDSICLSSSATRPGCPGGLASRATRPTVDATTIVRYGQSVWRSKQSTLGGRITSWPSSMKLWCLCPLVSMKISFELGNCNFIAWCLVLKYGMEGRALIFGELEIDRCQALVNIMSTCPNCLASCLLMLHSFIVDILLEKYRISINHFASESLDVSSMSSFVRRRYLESWSPRSQNLDILGASYINPISPTKMNRFHHVSKWGSLQNQWLPCIMSIEFCRPHMHVSQAQLKNLKLPSPARLNCLCFAPGTLFLVL